LSSLDRPRLRFLNASRIFHEGRSLIRLDDPLGILSRPYLITAEWFEQVVQFFDGRTTLPEIQARVLRSTGFFLPLAELEQAVAGLEQAMVLEGPTLARFLEAYRQAGTRPPAFAGLSYAATKRALEAQLEQYFVTDRGAGRPGLAIPSAGFCGVFSPHIDFGRGGPVYSFAYRELVEKSQADVFVILGVAHKACRRKFALTRKDFETPLGLARTDREYVDQLIVRVGGRYLDDEIAHHGEHSIEFQVVFLQHVLAGRGDFSIVPILVGSFRDLMAAGKEPGEDGEVTAFVEALREVEAASGKRVVYIGGIDLCHVGPEFGDPEPVSLEKQEEIRRFDEALLARASQGDAAGWYETAVAIGNRHRVCGLEAGYTILRTMRAGQGQLLRYDQAVDPQRLCLVSFASMTFHCQDPAGDAAAS